MQNVGTNGGGGTTYTFTNGVTNVAGVVSTALLPGSNITLSTNAGAITITATGATNLPVANLVQRIGTVDFDVVINGTSLTVWSNFIQNVSSSGVAGTPYDSSNTNNTGNFSWDAESGIAVMPNIPLTGVTSTNYWIEASRLTQLQPTNYNTYGYTEAKIITASMGTTNVQVILNTHPGVSYGLGGTPNIHVWTNRFRLHFYTTTTAGGQGGDVISTNSTAFTKTNSAPAWRTSSGSTAFDLYADSARVTTAPVAVMRPVLDQSVMVLDLMPRDSTGANPAAPTNQMGAGVCWVHLVNRDLSVASDPENWNAVGIYQRQTPGGAIATMKGGTNILGDLEISGSTLYFETGGSWPSSTVRGAVNDTGWYFGNSMLVGIDNASGLYSGPSIKLSGSLSASNVTLNTPVAGDNSTNAATTAHVQAKIRDIRNLWWMTNAQMRIFQESDFDCGSAAASFANPFWTGAAIASGTCAGQAAELDHPGIARATAASGATASGYNYQKTANTIWRLHGLDYFSAVFRPRGTNYANYSRIGFLNNITASMPTDGLMGMRSNNIFAGFSISNSTIVRTLSAYSLESNVWYRATVATSDDLTIATFTLLTGSNTVVWSDSLTNVLPIGRTLAHGVISLGTNAIAIDDWDTVSVGVGKNMNR